MRAEIDARLGTGRAGARGHLPRPHPRRRARRRPWAAKSLAAVSEWLDRPEVQVRRFLEQFLHGKAYLFGDEPDARVALVTSAHLTGAGLYANLELGVANYEPSVVNQALEWFNPLWARAGDYEDDLRELLFPGRRRCPGRGP